MTSLAVFPSFVSYLPWFSPILEVGSYDELNASRQAGGDWRKGVLLKRKTDETLSGVKHEDVIELSTGDLYAADKERWNIPYAVSIKAIGMVILTIPYISLLMASHLAGIIRDIFFIGKRAFSELPEHYRAKGMIEALIRFCVTLGCTLPVEVLKDIWGVVRAPFLGIGLLFASFYTIFSPLEGRAWISKTYTALYGSAGRQEAVFCPEERSSRSALLFAKALFLERKVCFLGFCMLKVGNIKDRTFSGLPKFEFAEEIKQKMEAQKQEIEKRFVQLAEKR